MRPNKAVIMALPHCCVRINWHAMGAWVVVLTLLCWWWATPHVTVMLEDWQARSTSGIVPPNHGFAFRHPELQPAVDPSQAIPKDYLYKSPKFLSSSKELAMREQCRHVSVNAGAANCIFQQDLAHSPALECNGIYCTMSMVAARFAGDQSDILLLSNASVTLTWANGETRRQNCGDSVCERSQAQQLTFGSSSLRLVDMPTLWQVVQQSQHWPGTSFGLYYHCPHCHNPFHMQQGFWRAYYLLVGHCLRPDRIVFLYADNNQLPMGTGLVEFMRAEYKYYCDEELPRIVGDLDIRRSSNAFAALLMPDYEPRAMPWPLWAHNNLLRFAGSRVRKYIGVQNPDAQCMSRRVLLLDRHGSRQVMNPLQVKSTIQAALGAESPDWQLMHVWMGDHSFEEQVQLIADACAIIGVHGAHFGMLTFMRPGTMVIEIDPFLWHEMVYELGAKNQDGIYERSPSPDVSTVVNRPGQSEEEWQRKLQAMAEEYLPPGVSLYDLYENSPVLQEMDSSKRWYMAQWIIIESAVFVNCTELQHALQRGLQRWRCVHPQPAEP